MVESSSCESSADTCFFLPFLVVSLIRDVLMLVVWLGVGERSS